MMHVPNGWVVFLEDRSLPGKGLFQSIFTECLSMSVLGKGDGELSCS